MVTRTLPAALIALSLAAQANGPAPLGWGGRPVTWDTLPRTVYTAHRGGALEAPENSMAALAAAYERGAAQVIDADTRMLRDGTLVVMHDATLDRTTTSSGPVRALTARHWRDVRLRAGGERPPTVDEVLDRFGGRTLVMLEAKDPDSLGRLARAIHRRGLSRSVLVNTNRPDVARRAHHKGLTAQLWRSARQLRTDDPRSWRSFVDVLDVDHGARDTDLRRAVRSGIARVWAHTVNTPKARDRALRLGCDGIITDAPELLARTPAVRR
ncbi:glycerophosphodiester phosphodiesterase [Streptomyces sp. A3M-1-3]|uniref:glycerophosphodiester phosphodiesterase n=1 Tax=Streptomyces sp. A3M-1-3 TaxID=2962044 RepID=UPI0020B6A7F5|nr:glycerophosphodiester phosphodiesterase [Streptomyces sp. A3M-1-3]MCP3817561.1 glycerophosphodiester phosphodiesterase [Streptomyces sp. A3M-1-3]